MNKYLQFIYYILVSIILIISQTSIFTPRLLGLFSPDLNLILIIYLSLNPSIKNALALVILNGLLMDFFSGNTLGFHTLSRIIVYILLRNSVSKFDFSEVPPIAFALFIATTFFWTLIFMILKFKSIESITISLNLIIHQATINTVVGVFLILLFRKIDAKFQK